MPNVRQNFSVKKKLKFKLDPVVEKVQVGGGLLYCDVLGLHKAKESKVDEDDRYFSDLQVLCTLPSAAHRLYSIPTHYSKKQANIFDLVVSCKFDAPSIYPLPGVENALEIPGFGLAHLAIPKRFEIAIDEMTSFWVAWAQNLNRRAQLQIEDLYSSVAARNAMMKCSYVDIF